MMRTFSAYPRTGDLVMRCVEVENIHVEVGEERLSRVMVVARFFLVKVGDGLVEGIRHTSPQIPQFAYVKHLEQVVKLELVQYNYRDHNRRCRCRCHMNEQAAVVAAVQFLEYLQIDEIDVKVVEVEPLEEL